MDGKYQALAGGGFATVNGIQEMAQRISMKLTAKRGGFPLLPKYGSELYRLGAVKPSERRAVAEKYVAAALSDERGLVLENLEISYTDDETILVGMEFSCDNEVFSVTTTI